MVSPPPNNSRRLYTYDIIFYFFWKQHIITPYQFTTVCLNNRRVPSVPRVPVLYLYTSRALPVIPVCVCTKTKSDQSVHNRFYLPFRAMRYYNIDIAGVRQNFTFHPAPGLPKAIVFELMRRPSESSLSVAGSPPPRILYIIYLHVY